MNIEFLPVKHLITRNTGRRRERLKIPHSARENVNEVDTAALFYAVLCPRPVLKITHRLRQTADRQIGKWPRRQNEAVGNTGARAILTRAVNL